MQGAVRCRICKDPIMRKAEILAAADVLFREKGYENTAVSDIVKKVGVAQGTFYYYFRTKEEVLDTLLTNVWEEFSDYMAKLVQVKEQSVLERLRQILLMLFRQNQLQTWECWFKQAPRSEMERMHARCDQMRNSYVKPYIQQLVLAGMDDGSFVRAAFPDTLTEIVFYGISHYIHEHYTEFQNPDRYSESLITLDELLSKVLGLQAGQVLDLKNMKKTI